MNMDGELLKGIQKVIAHLPRFEEPCFVFGTWRSQNPPPGVVSPDWYGLSETARAWRKAVYDSGLMLRGFDWGKWQHEAQVYVFTPEKLEEADLETVRKLLTIHLRKERFCEGHLEEMFEAGHLTAIMRRLKQIADHMEGSN